VCRGNWEFSGAVGVPRARKKLGGQKMEEAVNHHNAVKVTFSSLFGATDQWNK
jgi:hypothetical protein